MSFLSSSSFISEEEKEEEEVKELVNHEQSQKSIQRDRLEHYVAELSQTWTEFCDQVLCWLKKAPHHDFDKLLQLDQSFRQQLQTLYLKIYPNRSFVCNSALISAFDTNIKKEDVTEFFDTEDYLETRIIQTWHNRPHCILIRINDFIMTPDNAHPYDYDYEYNNTWYGTEIAKAIDYYLSFWQEIRTQDVKHMADKRDNTCHCEFSRLDMECSKLHYHAASTYGQSSGRFPLLIWKCFLFCLKNEMPTFTEMGDVRHRHHLWFLIRDCLEACTTTRSIVWCDDEQQKRQEFESHLKHCFPEIYECVMYIKERYNTFRNLLPMVTEKTDDHPYSYYECYNTAKPNMFALAARKCRFWKPVHVPNWRKVFINLDDKLRQSVQRSRMFNEMLNKMTCLKACIENIVKGIKSEPIHYADFEQDPWLVFMERYYAEHFMAMSDFDFDDFGFYKLGHHESEAGIVYYIPHVTFLHRFVACRGMKPHARVAMITNKYHVTCKKYENWPFLQTIAALVFIKCFMKHNVFRGKWFLDMVKEAHLEKEEDRKYKEEDYLITICHARICSIALYMCPSIVCTHCPSFTLWTRLIDLWCEWHIIDTVVNALEYEHVEQKNDMCETMDSYVLIVLHCVVQKQLEVEISQELRLHPPPQVFCQVDDCVDVREWILVMMQYPQWICHLRSKIFGKKMEDE